MTDSPKSRARVIAEQFDEDLRRIQGELFTSELSDEKRNDIKIILSRLRKIDAASSYEDLVARVSSKLTAVDRELLRAVPTRIRALPEYRVLLHATAE